MKKINYQELQAYEFISEEYISDVSSTCSYLIHKKSGARISVLNNDEENKVFTIAFRTPPSDSTGVPHIMEHSVLCGSKDFPVKDPFVELVKGSLNTFLNAMTYPDKTVYPVASCNDKDFRNLMHVYLDAVFYPNIYIHDEIFRQEGWSYSMEDKDSPLTINGVVYNEMKGVFSSPDDIVSREIFNSLYPDTCYSVESGGDPLYIPDLTYEAFLDFHKKYYHPSNSFIYLYGDMDYVEVLNWMDEKYLSAFDLAQIDSAITEQKPFDNIKYSTIEYPVGENEPLEGNAYLTWNMVCGNSLDTKLMQAMEILDYSLLSAPGAPLEKALLEAGIGNDISGSFETDCLQPFFSVLAKNAEEKDLDRFVEVIKNTLKDIVAKGMDSKALKAGINYYEFRVREADFGRMPKGLAYCLMMLSDWIYKEASPFECFHMLDNYSWLRTQIDTGYFEDLIQKYLLDNEHGSIIKAVPVRGLSTTREKELAAKLELVKASMTEEEIHKIVKDTAELKEYQEAEEKEEDLNKIPLLNRSDLRRSVRNYSYQEHELQEGIFLHHNYDTNGIAYIQMLFEIRDMPLEFWPFISILQAVLGVIDTDNYTYGDLFNEINLSTGGIGTSVEMFKDFNDSDLNRRFFDFKGKALYNDIPILFEMVSEIILRSKLSDTVRLKEILLQSLSQLQAKFMSAGHTVAVGRSMANQGGNALIKEISQGVAFYRFLKVLTHNYDSYKEKLVEILKYLTVKIFTKSNLLVSFTGSAEKKDEIIAIVENWKLDLKDVEFNSFNLYDFAKDISNKCRLFELSKKEGLYCASQVQYVSRTGNFVKAGYKYTGAMHALRTILGYEYLWEKVRVTGGAYGCMNSYQRTGECFLVSYRDPHLSRTNDVFMDIPDYLADFYADERTMTKYIIGACSDIDQPLSPESLGIRSMAAYITGIDISTIQKERDQLLDATYEDIRALAPVIQSVLDNNEGCTVGGEEKVKNSSELFDVIFSLL